MKNKTKLILAHLFALVSVVVILTVNQFMVIDLKDGSGTILPKILLQPLVENAIYHGIKPKLAQGKISILAQLEGEDLLLTVQDNGVGMTEEQVKQLEEAFNIETVTKEFL